MAESETPETTDAPNETPAPSGTPAWLVIIVVGLAVSQLGLWVWVSSLSSSNPPKAAVAQELELAFQEYANTIAGFRAELDAALANNSDTERFNLQQESLSELATRLEALEARPSAGASGPMTDMQLQAMADLMKDVRSLNDRVDEEGQSRLQQIQLLTAFDRLEERVHADAPYGQALEAFRIAAKDMKNVEEKLEVLSRAKHEGIASWEQLEAQFESARRAALSGGATEGGSFWGSVKGNLSGLVEVRKTGPAHPGDDVDSVLARAAFALEQHDRTSVIEELSRLDEPTILLFEEFSAKLNERHAVLSLLDTIRAELAAGMDG